MKQGPLTVAALLLLFGAVACTPKVGSDAWCAAMSEKPKGDWTANQAADFARYCLLKVPDKERP
jgi:hypothetical protein